MSDYDLIISNGIRSTARAPRYRGDVGIRSIASSRLET